MAWRRFGNKYNAKRVEEAGYSFASNLERRVYRMLCELELAKEIIIEKVQDRVFLTEAKIDYRPDFRILDLKLNEQVWVEAKGEELEPWRTKKKLWRVYGPGRLRIYKQDTRKNIYLVEEINPRGAKKDDVA